ncbi:MAG: tetratricopeptide repeat protein [Clostridium sp.]|nr:tetratricopeptide repeat protein [Clostridium sp.]MDD7283362.1 tetratricopeptide repeat protein [Clostridium sp.]
MATTMRPVLCPHCGAQVRKNGYCSACYLPLAMLKKAENTSNYYYNISYDRASARDLSGAVESLLQSLRYNKRNIQARNLLGLIYYEMGEAVLAMSEWVMSINYQQDNNIATRYLKELKKEPQRLESADQLARKFNMAIQYAHSEDYDLAILQLKSTLSDNPHFVKGYLLLALLYIHEDNYEKARVTLRRVLKIDKANPQAIHYLREMGDTEENIIEMRKQNVENDGLLDDDYLEEIVVTEDGQSPKKTEKRNIFQEIKAKRNTNVVRTGEFDPVSLARYSGLYVLLGLVFGVLLFCFFILPGQKKKLRNENEQLIKTYSEELAGKNSTINSLSAEVESLNKQIETLQNGAAKAGENLPDYSNVVSGMSDTDLQNMIDKE